MHRDTAGTQHALYFSKDRVFLFRNNMAEHVETYHVVEAVIGKGQPRELGREGIVVTVAVGGQGALV